MNRWQQGTYRVKNGQKYVGNKLPTYRSSWELRFCSFCDENPSIIKWASENIRIPYQNPITGKHTNYVPDFMIQYIDKNGREHVELIEIKPASQTTLEAAGRSQKNQAQVTVNAAKWSAAQEFCKRRGITFKVITENDIFRNNKPRKNRPRNSRTR